VLLPSTLQVLLPSRAGLQSSDCSGGLLACQPPRSETARDRHRLCSDPVGGPPWGGDLCERIHTLVDQHACGAQVCKLLSCGQRNLAAMFFSCLRPLHNFRKDIRPTCMKKNLTFNCVNAVLSMSQAFLIGFWIQVYSVVFVFCML
jgi:hypothetical protein